MLTSFPFFSSRQMIIAARILVALTMVSHGIARLYAGTVIGFGAFLSDKGFPLGLAWAWAITIFEIAAGVALTLGKYVKIACALFILEMLMGILLVHAANGWFVIGYTTGGIEYSILIITVLLLISAFDNEPVKS